MGSVYLWKDDNSHKLLISVINHLWNQVVELQVYMFVRQPAMILDKSTEILKMIPFISFHVNVNNVVVYVVR